MFPAIFKAMYFYNLSVPCIVFNCVSVEERRIWQQPFCGGKRNQIVCL